jgi:hypothetical protein
MRKITLLLLILVSTQCFARNLVELYITQNGQLVRNVCNADGSALNNGIPKQTAITSEYPITFTYVSQFADLTYNNFKPYFDDGFTITSNDCPSDFGGGNVCTITGYYKPPKLGENRFRFWYHYGLNDFYCNAYTQTTQYVGEPKIELSDESKPFATYYASPEVPSAVYVFKNDGSNRATISGVNIDGKPTQESYSVIDNCRGASLNPTQSCSMIFGGWLVAGVHQFSITLNYDGKQYVYSETVVVGDDKKVVGCKIG